MLRFQDVYAISKKKVQAYVRRPGGKLASFEARVPRPHSVYYSHQWIQLPFAAAVRRFQETCAQCRATARRSATPLGSL